MRVCVCARVSVCVWVADDVAAAIVIVAVNLSPELVHIEVSLAPGGQTCSCFYALDKRTGQPHRRNAQ